MTDYNEITTGEVDPGSPITTSLMTRLRDNVLGIAEGSPDEAPVPRVAFDLDGKTAIATDELDTSKVSRPDGAGSVIWGPEGAVNPPHYIRYGLSPNGGGSAENAIGGTEEINAGGWSWAVNGELTVPQSGVYMVYLRRYGSTAGAYFFQVNSITPAYVPGGGGDYEWTIPVRLTAGDIVRIRTSSSTSNGGNFTLGLVRV